MCGNLHAMLAGPKTSQTAVAAKVSGNCACGCGQCGEGVGRLKEEARRVAFHINALGESEIAELAQATRRWLRPLWHGSRGGPPVRQGFADSTFPNSAACHIVAEAIREGGRPLEQPVRRFMERRFGQGFGF